MIWDADSNRVSFTSSTGGSYAFVYDITAGIPAVLRETGSAYDKNYVREPDGSLIAMFVGSYPYYYHFDALGSTRMLTDETGHITDSYTYDPWGTATHPTGSIQQPYQYVGQLGYYTHYQDANLPLLQLGVRFYDPGVGRFTQVDPISYPGYSAYEYARSRPVTLVDPTGLEGYGPAGDKDWYEACLDGCTNNHSCEDDKYGLACTIAGTAAGAPWGTGGGVAGAGFGYWLGSHFNAKYHEASCIAWCNARYMNASHGRRPLPNPAYNEAEFCKWKRQNWPPRRMPRGPYYGTNPIDWM